MGETDTDGLYRHYDNSRRVYAWTALVDREVPDALGHASVELHDESITYLVHLTGGHAEEGTDTFGD